MTTTTGVPLAVTLTPANQHDLQQLLPLVFLEFPHIGGRPGRPLDRPLSVTADKGYDSQSARELLTAAGIEPQILRRGETAPSPLGAIRWPIERTLSWLKQFRRLRIRWDRLSEIHEAFLQLGCIVILARFLAH